MERELEKLVNSKRNVVVSGNSLAGKTYGLIVPIVKETIKKNESLFIVDADYQIYNQVYDSLGDYKKIVVDLNNPVRGDKWNPLLFIKKLYKSGKKDEALAFLYDLSMEIMFERDSMDPFWTESAADLMIAAVLSLIIDGKDEELNFNSVQEIITKCATKDGIDYLSNVKDKTVNSYASGVIYAPRETRGGIVSVASQKIRLYATRLRLSNLLSESSFDYDVLNEKCVIFLETNKMSNYISSLVRVFISQIRNYIDIYEINNKLNIIIDNFDNINYGMLSYNYLSTNSYDNVKVYLVLRSCKEIEEKIDYSLNVLADIININEDSICVDYGNGKIEEFNRFDNIIINDKRYELELPEIKEKEINIFKLPNSLSIDELISKIDKKIEELEKED